MCWVLGSKEGSVVVGSGGNNEGEGLNQLKYPQGLSFDVENNLYVADLENNRVQRFLIDKNEDKTQETSVDEKSFELNIRDKIQIQ